VWRATVTRIVKSPIVDGKRLCTKCSEEKPIEEFYRKTRPWKRDGDDSGPAGHMAECKDCFRLRLQRARDVKRAFQLENVAPR